MTFLVETFGVVGDSHGLWHFLTSLTVTREGEPVATTKEALLCGEVADAVFQSSAGTTRATVERLT